MFQGCFLGDSMVFQGVLKGLQGYFDNVSGIFLMCFIVFQGCSLGVSQGCYIFVSKVIQGCFNCILKMFQGYFKDNINCSFRVL